MKIDLQNAVADIIGKRNVSEEFAKQYVNDHYIPFLIYQHHNFRMAELRKLSKTKPVRIRKTYTYKN